ALPLHAALPISASGTSAHAHRPARKPGGAERRPHSTPHAQPDAHRPGQTRARARRLQRRDVAPVQEVLHTRDQLAPIRDPPLAREAEDQSSIRRAVRRDRTLAGDRPHGADVIRAEAYAPPLTLGTQAGAPLMTGHIRQFVARLDRAPRREVALEARTEFGSRIRVRELDRKAETEPVPFTRIEVRQELDSPDVDLAAVVQIAFARAARRERRPPEHVVLVAIEAHDLEPEPEGAVPDPDLVVHALLGLRPLRSAGARRAEPTVHPAEDPERRPELTTDPDPGDPDRDLVATLGDRGGARRIRHGIIRSLEVDLLVPDPRRDRPAAECNVILNVERPRPRTAHTVRLAARRTPVRQPHHTADHLVPVVVLEPILLVLVVP